MGILAECLIEWAPLPSGADADVMKAQAGAFRVAEVLNLIVSALAKKP